ncbi:MAG: hypothetical protein RMK84_12825 [Oscillochloridaceae bacterium]|nr:DUF2157 domain-containing protein [Chloroflexaceae bacterium]MDW8391003.1 hypothetical protein [Oscillochloridaceae bacterium]
MLDLLTTLLCTALLGMLFLALIVWLARRPAGPRTVNPYVPSPAGQVTPEQFIEFDALVQRWVAEERLSPAVGSAIRSLIAADYAAAGFGTFPSAAATAPNAASAPAASSGDVARPVAPVAPVAASPPLAASPAPVAAAPSAPIAAEPPPRVSARSWGAALLALGTRRALLYLGAFLLVISSLTLVIFNWASFSPLVQFAILAGTTVALWGLGTWMARQPALGAAGANLQAVAALLVPVVGFALSRHGLLDLAPRPAWQLASALSLGLYLLTAWRTRRAFYAGAAVVAALSLIFAAPEALDGGWKSAVATIFLAALVPLTIRLRSTGATGSATGVAHVSLVGAPLLALGACTLYLAGLSDGLAFGVTLLVTALFCVLRYRADRRGWWFWAAVALPPLALVVILAEFDPPLRVQALALALLALAYLWLSAALEQRARPAAAPLALGALLIGALALLPAGLDLNVARFALGPLAAMGLSAIVLVERGRFAWLGSSRDGLAAGALAGGGAALAGWLGALLTLTPLTYGQIGLLLLPLAALAFAGARWWPGSLRPAYDPALQTLGIFIALAAGGLALENTATQLPAALLLTLIFGAQAALRRGWPWAVLSLGAGLLVAWFALERFVPGAAWTRAATLTALALSAAYTLGGERLRATALRYWTWPAIAWGALAGAFAAALALLQVFDRHPLAALTFLSLAGLAALHSFRWRQPLLGYGVALLLATGALVAAGQGFFTAWQPQLGDLALVVCALALGLALLGQALRRVDRSYGPPYEWVAFFLLPLAPLLVLGDSARLALIWGSMAGLYALALWRYRQPWLLALAFIAADLATFHAVAWQLPDNPREQAGLLLAGLVWLQALASAALRRGPAPWNVAGLWGYNSAAVGGVGALALASASDGALASAALALAALLAVLAQVERSEAVAWGSLALAVPGAWLAHTAAGLEGAWAAAWLVLELVGLSLLGWLAIRSGLVLWRRVTGDGALGAAALLTLGATLGGQLAPLTFALASLGLLLATVAVREQQAAYAYGAGGAFVGAALSQLAGWGVRELQWYVIPAGLYLLVLAGGLRRFQGQRRASQLIEAAAVMLLLGVTTAQALLPEGGLFYSLLLFGESLVMATYGALSRLRVPFVGGIAFFVAGVLWMTVDTVRLANQWVILGIVGLMMVLAYVVLERHQERLLRAGRFWAEQLRAWE